jgi:hypothetical protein
MKIYKIEVMDLEEGAAVNVLVTCLLAFLNGGNKFYATQVYISPQEHWRNETWKSFHHG